MDGEQVPGWGVTACDGRTMDTQTTDGDMRWHGGVAGLGWTGRLQHAVAIKRFQGG